MDVVGADGEQHEIELAFRPLRRASAISSVQLGDLGRRRVLGQ